MTAVGASGSVPDRMARARLAAIVLAAGKGTRMKSDLPKVLHPIGGRPLVRYPVELAIALGAEPVVVVVGHGAERVEAALEASHPGRCRFRLQAEQRGTGHAVQQAMPELEGFDGRVLILYGDVPLLTEATARRLGEALKGKRSPLAAVTMMLDDPTGYGRIVRDEAGRARQVVEHKDATEAQRAIREVNAGIYLVGAAFLRDALGRLRSDNAQGEYYLTDVVEMAAAAGGVETVVLRDPTEVMGANDRAQLAELDDHLRRRILHRHLTSGVTIQDPATTWIEPDVEIGAETVLRANVHLRGRTVIGRGCHVDTGCVLTDARLGDRVEVRPYTIIDEARVHDGAILGPFARLRPAAEVMDEAHVGNFVELKKTRLGRGAKANHLAYLGDADIGAGTNVGAGTITCNYDGHGKHRTVMGERVFIGSNATLVAPLTIADGAYVAAGSTITSDVAPDALALGRARQVDKPGRAAQVRAEASARAAEAKRAAAAEAEKKSKTAAAKKAPAAKKKATASRARKA